MHNRERLPLVILSAWVALSLAPVATGDTNAYVPAVGGSWDTAGNWSLGHCPLTGEDVEIISGGAAHKSVTYGSAGAGQTFNFLTVDGSGSFYGALWHLSHALAANEVRIGDNGEAFYWMESAAQLSVTDDLYVGYYGGPATLHIAVDPPGGGAGIEVDNIIYCGYSGDAVIEHLSGAVDAQTVYVGQNAPGEYRLSGDPANSTLNFTYHLVVGNADEGLFDQTGGSVSRGAAGIGVDHHVMLGLNSGGVGTYLMKGGLVDVDRVSIGWNGDGYFTQTGGTVNIEEMLLIGYDGTHPNRAWYKIDDADGPAELNVGSALRVGELSLGKFEQTGGDVTVGTSLSIGDGSDDPALSSYVYLGHNAGLLDVGDYVSMTGGDYDQDGGVLNTPDVRIYAGSHATLDNQADFRANTLSNYGGSLVMYRNAIIRGKFAFPPNIYYVCNFTNYSGATFQMGTAAVDGGSFRGALNNQGTFDYYQGDFGWSTLLNSGAFNYYGPFECIRLVQYGDPIDVTPTTPLTATGVAQSNAVENNARINIEAGATVHLGAGKAFVNNGDLYAPGTIDGDLENNGYLTLALTRAINQLNIYGWFVQSAAATTRLRLEGTDRADFDRVVVDGPAVLAGTLDVDFSGFPFAYVPSLGDTFDVLHFASRSGMFDTLDLPALPDPTWEWQVHYLYNELVLSVVDEAYDPGDCDQDQDVDFGDFEGMLDCLSGPGVLVPRYCSCHDLDNNADVSLADIGILQMHFTGP